MSEKRMTLREIAALAGVSLTTASMYLNGKAKRYNLAETTCQRIEKIMREHHFVPNIHARAIASKKTFLAGVMISDGLDKSFWFNILAALEDALSEKSYHMLLSVTKSDSGRQEESMRFMEAQGVDGLIIDPVAGTEKSVTEFAKRKPTVTLNTKIEGVSCAWNDDYFGGRTAVSAMLDAGHKHIAYVGAGSSSPDEPFTRVRAYSDAMAAHKLKPVFFPDAESFLKRRGEFTSAVCFSDYVLLDLYQQANEAGIRIPRDFSVIGYDNMYFAPLLSPAPATINQYKSEIGSAAAEALLALIASDNAGIVEHRFEPFLIPGKTIRKNR